MSGKSFRIEEHLKTQSSEENSYDSHHHPKVKSGIVDYLSHRAKWICEKGSALSDELKHVHNALMANGYPRHALKRRHKKRRRDGPGNNLPAAILCDVAVVITQDTIK